jgi:hypothetical protein
MSRLHLERGNYRDLLLLVAISAMPTTATPIGIATGVSAKKKIPAARTMRAMPPMSRYLFKFCYSFPVQHGT